ncbi:MAG TPA: hypothetical protein VND64_05450 [Pirellulales bacterium]|nr:hypothetical protein [Pirellulales bacterium]
MSQRDLPTTVATRKTSSRLYWLAALAVASWLVYLAIAARGQSLHVEGSGGRSLLTILAMFGFCFVCYLAALRIALAVPQDRRLMGIILTASVAFRLTLLLSDPIEEIDIYRYLWDGAVSTQGVSPFRYAPDQVLAAAADDVLPADLARLVALRDGSPALRQILSRIHYGELPTIYPPVSQLVFALATWTTPRAANVWARMTVMKAWFVLFDLATLLLVIRLLRKTGRHIGWAVAYGWCPLLIKEIANSGHLDALAVFLTTFAVERTVAVSYGEPPSSADAAIRQLPAGMNRGAAWVAALALALAVGAKLYPLVLAPLWLGSLVRRLGWRAAAGPASLFAMTTALVLWPMVPHGEVRSRSEPTRESTVVGDDAPPLPPVEGDTMARDPSESLRAFLSRWEMNDFLFLLVMENLRPTESLPPKEVAWFSVVPEAWRRAILSTVEARFSVGTQDAAFFMSRVLTSVAFLAVACALAWLGARAATAADWLRAAFLTVAWFWLLLPTLNPWYWSWAMPLLPFARGRAWLALSGLALVYYLRFWLVYHFSDVAMLGTRYTGPFFFDYVVTWFEFGPWFVWLAVDFMISILGRVNYDAASETSMAISRLREEKARD